MGSVTQECQMDKREFEGRNLVVIDTPGLFDTDKDPFSVAYEISKAVGISAPGPHAFIIVIKAGGGRYTREAEETVKLVHDIFGGDVIRYCIVVFTGEDNIHRDDSTATLENWLAQSTDSVVSLVEACNRRCMAIDTTEASKEQLDNKVREFMSIVDHMVQENGGRVYTNEMLGKAEQAYREREEELLRVQKEEQERRQRQIDQDQDALLAARLQAEEREKQVRTQCDALVATHREQQRNEETRAKARDRNPDTIKKEDGVWESFFKSALPIISEGISKVYLSSTASPSEQTDGSLTLNDHSSSGRLRQPTGRQEENSSNFLFPRHASGTGLLGLRAPGTPYRHPHMANSPTGRSPTTFGTRGIGFGAGPFGGMSRGGGPAHHHHHH
ncbi:unnamed protein product [Rotaria sordida]|uniref:AIG1-type G domain-containing protein n=1 Tax=Rotaria sordida TaxID=392033 RepID=A0A815B7L2_9BILA|nr:unnamed protein product [Rotaria sordida]CAF1310139.1 unnamed protein product [Rotaria sordida]CAF1545150.1 unnamed protein product [Rotaria sordida]